MKLLLLLATMSCVDLLIGGILALKSKAFVSSKLKDGALKKVCILLVCCTFVVGGRFFPELSFMQYSILPFILSEVTSLKEFAEKNKGGASIV